MTNLHLNKLLSEKKLVNDKNKEDFKKVSLIKYIRQLKIRNIIEERVLYNYLVRKIEESRILLEEFFLDEIKRDKKLKIITKKTDEYNKILIDEIIKNEYDRAQLEQQNEEINEYIDQRLIEAESILNDLTASISNNRFAIKDNNKKVNKKKKELFKCKTVEEALEKFTSLNNERKVREKIRNNIYLEEGLSKNRKNEIALLKLLSDNNNKLLNASDSSEINKLLVNQHIIKGKLIQFYELNEIETIKAKIQQIIFNPNDNNYAISMAIFIENRNLGEKLLTDDNFKNKFSKVLDPRSKILKDLLEDLRNNKETLIKQSIFDLQDLVSQINSSNDSYVSINNKYYDLQLKANTEIKTIYQHLLDPKVTTASYEEKFKKAFYNLKNDVDILKSELEKELNKKIEINETLENDQEALKLEDLIEHYKDIAIKKIDSLKKESSELTNDIIIELDEKEKEIIKSANILTKALGFCNKDSVKIKFKELMDEIDDIVTSASTKDLSLNKSLTDKIDSSKAIKESYYQELRERALLLSSECDLGRFSSKNSFDSITKGKNRTKQPIIKKTGNKMIDTKVQEKEFFFDKEYKILDNFSNIFRKKFNEINTEIDKIKEKNLSKSELKNSYNRILDKINDYKNEFNSKLPSIEKSYTNLMKLKSDIKALSNDVDKILKSEREKLEKQKAQQRLK